MEDNHEQKIEAILEVMRSATLHQCFTALVQVLREHAEGWDMWNIQRNVEACDWAAKEVEKVFDGLRERM